MSDPLSAETITGCLLGQAVGDALGLPMENLHRDVIARRFASLDRMRFLFGRGVVSDDTEHAACTAVALLRAGTDANHFRKNLAWRLRWWFAGLPVGTGLATLKACIKLWLGFPSTHSGVFSAGNGPAMRATVLGVCVLGEGQLVQFVRESTRLTHTDSQAKYGAAAVALAARLFALSRGGPPPRIAELIAALERQLPHEPTFDALLGGVEAGLVVGQTVAEFAESVCPGRGRVSGYMYHTVPVVLFAAFRHPDDYRTAIEAVIRCGGDTDTTAAILGGILGARNGVSAIPEPWLAGLCDFPTSKRYLERTAGHLADKHWRTGSADTEFYHGWFSPIRSLLVFAVVLGHLVRRLRPW